MDRRAFLQSLAGLGSTFAFLKSPRACFGADAIVGKAPTDRISLAGGKISASRLALGTGTNGVGGNSNQTRKMGDIGVADLFREAYDLGINFWDAADQYGSHSCLKQALKTIPRDKVVILTKSHASTAAEMRNDIDRFRQEIGTDYLDILLLHCMTSPDWPKAKAGAMEAVQEAQSKGIVRMRGVSCHSLDALKAAAASKWVELDLARVNPYGRAMDGKPDQVLPVLREMKRDGKTVMGMKVFGGGSLRNKVEECLKYQLSLDCVDCFTLGFENRDEFRSAFQILSRLAGVTLPK